MPVMYCIWKYISKQLNEFKNKEFLTKWNKHQLNETNIKQASKSINNCINEPVSHIKHSKKYKTVKTQHFLVQ